MNDDDVSNPPTVVEPDEIKEADPVLYSNDPADWNFNEPGID